jgi:hypothetical protein
MDDVEFLFFDVVFSPSWEESWSMGEEAKMFLTTTSFGSQIVDGNFSQVEPPTALWPIREYEDGRAEIAKRIRTIDLIDHDDEDEDEEREGKTSYSDAQVTKFIDDMYDVAESPRFAEQLAMYKAYAEWDHSDDELTALKYLDFTK